MRVTSAARSLTSVGSTLLSVGARGAPVTQLQQQLNRAGISCGVDGIFGSGTKAAVMAFQRAHGLTADGIVGPNTWAALSRGAAPAPAPASSGGLLQQGARGAQVTALQNALNRAGISCGVDGIFGPGTRAAVVRFQASRGLTADGIVGPRTWAALNGAAPAPAPAPSTGAGTPLLRRGSSGAAVTNLQRALAQAGFNPGAVDGVFGANTEAAVRRFQAARGLSVDGIVGPNTWRALSGGSSFDPAPVNTNPVSSSGSLRQRILDIARGELGNREATNNNDGVITKYPGYFGRGRESWCADFVSWVSTHAGAALNYAYVPYLETHLKSVGKWKGRSNPQPGDLVTFDWDHDGVADHVGFVESVNANGSINTIEGNTGNPGSGVEGVWRRTRSLSDVHGFGNP